MSSDPKDGSQGKEASKELPIVEELARKLTAEIRFILDPETELRPQKGTCTTEYTCDKYHCTSSF